MARSVIVVGKSPVNDKYAINQAELMGNIVPVCGGIIHSAYEFNLMLDEKLNVIVPEDDSIRIGIVLPEEVDAMFFLCEAVKQVNLYEFGLTESRKEKISKALHLIVLTNLTSIIKQYPVSFLNEKIKQYT